MLKRATCTIYLAQESDTFGKDSELASTLAQGKPVIAFIPEGDNEYIDELLGDLQAIYPEKDETYRILEHIKGFAPSLVLNDMQLTQWLCRITKANAKEVKKRLRKIVCDLYNKRAKSLRDTHPLGLQVNLSTGVANGVLVVRTVDQCAKLVRSILTKTMKFDLELVKKENGEYLFLREKISHSIFRVVTGDAMLTNTFWNYYLEQAE